MKHCSFRLNPMDPSGQTVFTGWPEGEQRDCSRIETVAPVSKKNDRLDAYSFTTFLTTFHPSPLTSKK